MVKGMEKHNWLINVSVKVQEKCLVQKKNINKIEEQNLKL